MSRSSKDLGRSMDHESLLTGYRTESSIERTSDEKTSMAKKSYFYINFLYAYYSIVFTVAIPALPALALKICDDDSSRAAYLYGTANFVRYFMEFVASPLMGSLSDYIGRKPMLIFAFLICGAEFILLSLFPSVGMLYFSRAMAGIGDSAQAICYTVTTDIAIFNNDKVTYAYGLLAGMMGLGFVIGPLLGGLLTDYTTVQICFLVIAIVSFLGAISTFFLLEESISYVSRPAPTSKEYSSVEESPSESNVSSTSYGSHETPVQVKTTYLQQINPIRPLLIHFSNETIRKLSYPLILSSLTQGLGFIWYIYMDARYHTTATDVGIYLAFFGIVSLVVQGVLIEKIIPAIWNEKQAAVYGYFLQALQYTGYGFMPYLYGLYGLVLLFAIALVADPSLKALIVKASLQQPNAVTIQGNLQGALSGIRTLCIAIGTLIFPTMYSMLVNYDTTLQFVPFLVGAFLFFMASAYLHCLPISEHLLSSYSKYSIVDSDSVSVYNTLLEYEHERKVDETNDNNKHSVEK